jgi:hypothetical protein
MPSNNLVELSENDWIIFPYSRGSKLIQPGEIQVADALEELCRERVNRQGCFYVPTTLYDERLKLVRGDVDGLVLLAIIPDDSLEKLFGNLPSSMNVLGQGPYNLFPRRTEKTAELRHRLTGVQQYDGITTRAENPMLHTVVDLQVLTDRMCNQSKIYSHVERAKGLHTL